MPFIVMCGLPSSGKTSRAQELKEYFEKERSIKTTLICDHDKTTNKNIVYSDSGREKELRSNLKSDVQRLINKEAVLILDSLNYIKGFRYELFCVTKSAQTPHCLIYCAANQDEAALWNSARPESEQYTQQVFDGLVMRFEAPDSRNRWDFPVFILTSSDSLPLTDIHDALFLRKPPPPNLSTLAQPLSATNFLHELDTTTQSVIASILEHQKTCVPGDSLTISGATDKLEVNRIIPMNELQRLRRQFIAFTKTRSAVDDSAQIANLFVQFLNNRV